MLIVLPVSVVPVRGMLYVKREQSVAERVKPVLVFLLNKLVLTYALLDASTMTVVIVFPFPAILKRVRHLLGCVKPIIPKHSGRRLHDRRRAGDARKLRIASFTTARGLRGACWLVQVAAR